MESVGGETLLFRRTSRIPLYDLLSLDYDYYETEVGEAES
jgi:hypothetical protein